MGTMLKKVGKYVKKALKGESHEAALVRLSKEKQRLKAERAVMLERERIAKIQKRSAPDDDFDFLGGGSSGKKKKKGKQQDWGWM